MANDIIVKLMVIKFINHFDWLYDDLLSTQANKSVISIENCLEDEFWCVITKYSTLFQYALEQWIVLRFHNQTVLSFLS